MLKFLIANIEFLGIIVSLLVGLIPLAIFLFTKIKEQQRVNFKNFHTYLVKGLSNQKGNTGLDDQVAIIFEFREYPKYYPVIRRLLKFKITHWKKSLKEKPHFNLLIKEAQETIKFINRFPLKRFFLKRINENVSEK